MRIVLDGGLGLRVVERGRRAPRGQSAGRTPGSLPLLLVHGFTGSVEAWAEVMDGLAEEWRVLAVDLPGHGESDVPARDGGLAIDAVVDDLVAVLDRSGVERPVWIGYSMGGRIALAAAILRPERVAGLVLESASPGLASEEERARRRVVDEERAAALEAGGLEAWVDEWMALPLFASQRDLPEEVRKRERERRLRSPVEGLARTLRELGTGRQPSFWDALPGVDVPVLLLTGALDAKFGDMAAAMERALPSSHRATVPGAGHAVHLEAPGEWLEAVRTFLRRAWPAAGAAADA